MAIQKLYLVRHGAAVSDAEDPERPLSAQGVAQVEKVASVLRGIELSVDVIYHGRLKRAEQTAEILGAAVQPSAGVRWRAGLGPNDSPASLLEELDAEEFGHVMIAGHLPHLARLASLLMVGQDQPGVISLGTGSVAALTRADSGSRWTLRWMIDPTIARR